MIDKLSEELIETTYLYCYKRLGNRQDAEDLAQEILLEALKAIHANKEIHSFHSWFWRMAKNRYANFIALRNNRPVALDSQGGLAANFMNPDEELILEEEISELNFCLSRLGAIYREIIILFYLKKYSIPQIAKELNIPEGTVKRRLFDAKKNIRERFDNMSNTGRSSYAPSQLDWFGGYRCAAAFRELKNLMAQQIVIYCRSEARSITEIADEIGVAPVYLEQEIHRLLEIDLIKEATKGKYLTNFCVFPKQPYVDALYVARKTFKDMDLDAKIVDALFKIKDKLLAYEFYGNDFDYEYLLWIFIVYACDRFGAEANKNYLRRYEKQYPLDKNRTYRITGRFTRSEETIGYSKLDNYKSMNWSNLHNIFQTPDYGRIEYINDYESSPFPMDRDHWVTENNVSLLIKLSKNPDASLTPYEEEMAADFISKGLLSKTDTGYHVEIPIVPNKVWKEMIELIGTTVAPLAESYEKTVTKALDNTLLPYVRKDLMEDFVHWNMQMLLQPTGQVFHYALHEKKILITPDSWDSSAAGLWMVTYD